eukprot:5377627-Lingulodinium_polyedra.AAC.1
MRSIASRVAFCARKFVAAQSRKSPFGTRSTPSTSAPWPVSAVPTLPGTSWRRISATGSRKA